MYVHVYARAYGWTMRELSRGQWEMMTLDDADNEDQSHSESKGCRHDYDGDPNEQCGVCQRRKAVALLNRVAIANQSNEWVRLAVDLLSSIDDRWCEETQELDNIGDEAADTRKEKLWQAMERETTPKGEKWKSTF